MAAKKDAKKEPEVVVGPHWGYFRQRGLYRATENEDGSATVVSPAGNAKHYDSWAEVDALYRPVPAGDSDFVD